MSECFQSDRTRKNKNQKEIAIGVESDIQLDTGFPGNCVFNLDAKYFKKNFKNPEIVLKRTDPDVGEIFKKNLELFSFSFFITPMEGTLNQVVVNN